MGGDRNTNYPDGKVIVLRGAFAECVEQGGSLPDVLWGFGDTRHPDVHAWRVHEEDSVRAGSRSSGGRGLKLWGLSGQPSKAELTGCGECIWRPGKGDLEFWKLRLEQVNALPEGQSGFY